MVAGCGYATKQHLLLAARKCAEISNNENWACYIARAICDNPASDEEVIAELGKSKYHSVTTIAHEKWDSMQ